MLNVPGRAMLNGPGRAEHPRNQSSSATPTVTWGPEAAALKAVTKAGGLPPGNIADERRSCQDYPEVVLPGTWFTSEVARFVPMMTHGEVSVARDERVSVIAGKRAGE